MLKDNPILMKLKQKVIKEGVVKACEKGFGFLEVSPKESFFISTNNMQNLIHGDKIEAEIVNVDSGKSQALPIRLIESSLKRFIARVSFEQGYLYLVPDSPTIKTKIRGKNKTNNTELVEGDWVVASLSEHGLEHGKRHMADIVEFIAHGNDPKVPWLVVLRNLDLPSEPPKDSITYIDNNESTQRTDFTNFPFVTIDSEKTKDMDDALYIEKNSDGSWKLYVAIADPTSYVNINDELDEEAKKRAFSIYLPGMDVPMLARSLSEEECSLKENEERNVLVCCISIDNEGKCNQEYSFCLAKIKSEGKLVYDNVSDYIESGFQNNNLYTKEIANQIKLLKDFCDVRCNYRAKQALIFKDKPEYEFVLNDDYSIKEVKKITRRIANKIVEECMIIANEVAGKYLAKELGVGIFNSHLGFDGEKLSELDAFLKENSGPEIDNNSLSSLDKYCEIKRWADSLNSDYIDCRLRKYQKFGEITTIPLPHFGLGLEFYATWTSPIRKYGDMVNHRLIKATLNGQSIDSIIDSSVLESMNVAKKLNKIAERMVKDWLYIDYMKSRIDNEYTMEIFDVSRGGIRGRIIENGAPIFIPALTICKDKKRLDLSNLEGIVKLDQKVIHKIGDIVNVVVREVNASTRSIIAEII